MNTREDVVDQILDQLREDFPGHRIWRAVRWDGAPGDWVATLLDPSAGVDATVICRDPQELRRTLEKEGQRAREGRRFL